MKMHRRLKSLVNTSVWSWILERTILRPMPRALGTRAPLEVLEIGCGRGDTTMMLSRWMPAARITCVDVDPEQTALASARLRGSGIQVRTADATRLPIADAAYDRVIEFDSFHHIANWRDAVAEACRVLRPGGTLIVADVSAVFFGPMLAWIDRPESRFTKTEFISAAGECGMTLETDLSTKRLIRCVFRKTRTGG